MLNAPYIGFKKTIDFQKIAKARVFKLSIWKYYGTNSVLYRSFTEIFIDFRWQLTEKID